MKAIPMQRARDDAAREEARQTQAAEAARAQAARLRPTYEAACGDHGRPAPEAAELLRKLTAASDTAARAAEAAVIAGGRRQELDRLLGAPSAEKQARSEYRLAVEARTAAADKVRRHGTLLADLEAKEHSEREALDQAIQRGAAQALADADPELRRLIAPDATGDAPDPVALAQRERNLASLQAQSSKLRRVVEAERQELQAAIRAEEQAHQAVLDALAAVAELAHAEALHAYLPALLKLRAAHEAAYGRQPDLPDLDRLTRDGLDEAIEAAKAAADATDESLLGRVVKAVAASR
jgi:hypothetical protein